MALSVASRAMFLNTALKPGFWDGDIEPNQYLDHINFSKCEITGQKQEFKRLISTMDGSAGEALASVPNPTDSARLAAEVNYMPGQILSLLLGADVAEIIVAQSIIANETINTALDIWVPLANRNISAVSVKTSADVAVDASKYTVDPLNGLIKAKDAAAVGAGMKVSYTKNASTNEHYKAGKAKSAYVKLIGTGTEKVSGRRALITIHKVSLAATGTFDLVGNDYLKGALEGDMLTPPGQDSPWEFTLL